MTRSTAPTEISLIELLRIIAEEWKTLFITFVLIIAITVIYTGISPRIYRAEVVMAPATSAVGGASLNNLLGNLGGLAGSLGVGSGGEIMNRYESIAILTSRSFTESFFEKYDLLPHLLPKEWDSGDEKWIDDEEPDMGDAFAIFDESVRRVDVSNKTGLVTLSIDWKSPEIAAKWANLLVYELNAQRRNSEIDEATRTLEHLQRELNKTSIVPIQQGIYELMEKQINLVALANVREEFALRIIDPATPPDYDRPISPKWLLSLIVGSIGGVFVGFLVVGSMRVSRALKAQP